MSRRPEPHTGLYHGGIRKLKRGDLILPPTRTGVPSCADYGAEAVCRRDRVYMVDDLDAAKMFALSNPQQGGGGDVYEVEPIGPTEPDPDYLGEGVCLQAPMARVIRVKARRVNELFGLTRDEFFTEGAEIEPPR